MGPPRRLEESISGMHAAATSAATKTSASPAIQFGFRDTSAAPARWPHTSMSPGTTLTVGFQSHSCDEKDSRRSERPSRLAARGVLLEIYPARLRPALQELSLLQTCRAVGESANLDRPVLTIKLDCQQPLDVARSAAA